MDRPTAEEALRRLEPSARQWKLRREGQPFSQRFTGTFADHGNTMTRRSEIAEDGVNFTTELDLVFRRVASR
jgi:hypothetical protein